MSNPAKDSSRELIERKDGTKDKWGQAECTERMDNLVKATAKQEGITEALKAIDQMEDIILRIVLLLLFHNNYGIIRLSHKT